MFIIRLHLLQILDPKSIQIGFKHYNNETTYDYSLDLSGKL